MTKYGFSTSRRAPSKECRYYLILVQDLGYGSTAEMEELLEQISKLLGAYTSAIESNR
jgi:hypothetical protein